MSQSQFCAKLLSTGACADPFCRLLHEVILCDPCSIILESSRAYDQHLTSPEHGAAVATQENATLLRCPVCDVYISGSAVWPHHVALASHRAKLAGSPEAAPETVHRNERMQSCDLCKVLIPHSDWAAHLSSAKHAQRRQFGVFKAALREAYTDKHGAAISHAEGGLDFGIIEVAAAAAGVRAELILQAASPSSRIAIVDANVPPGPRNVPSPFSAAIESTARVLVHGEDARVAVTFRHTLRGRYHGRVEVTLYDASARRRFVIVRDVRVVVGSVAAHQALGPETPYVRPKRAKWNKGGSVVRGDLPPAHGGWSKMAKKLPKAKINKTFIELMKGGSIEETIAQLRTRYVPKALGVQNYMQYFKILLWAEELQMERDLQMYEMSGVQLRAQGRLHFITVPGLAEKRPSVLIGDRISVQMTGSEKTYEGWVHDVRLNEVGISFHSSFKPQARPVSVRFHLNRTPIRRQHQALAHKSSLQPLLFPSATDAALARPLLPAEGQLTLKNELIGNNHPQLCAVKSVLKLKPGSAPFIIFGPPGTGKTVTAVESILQILSCMPDARILACAPSNSAADLIALRLGALNPDELFRFNAVSRIKNDVPEQLINYSRFDAASGHFTAPTKDELAKYKVIVSTCVSASYPYNIRMSAGHFTHIFIDEAGQATEPEVMTAIKTMATAATRVVLSGDPKQLGPVVRSKVALELGHGRSYLERLMDMALYDETGRGKSFIKLVKNFRSHPGILDFPNRRFYGGELEPCADPERINAFIGSPHLVTSDFPVIFHAISGKDEREGSSPSYFNIDEVTEGVDYIQKLTSDSRYPLAGADIGVIVPYRGQVRKFRRALAGIVDGVKVGSVEEFQGQERRAIILSTVRSSRDLLEYDTKYTLGFVANPRRFNVAVTRAQALLIVIGDPTVLGLDPMWRSFLNYVYHAGGWRGDPPPWNPDAPVREAGAYAQDAALADLHELTARLDALSVGVGGDGDGVLEQDVVGQDDADVDTGEPWRDLE